MSDPRVERGMARMLELRAARLADGATPIGWKIGFGAPAAFELLGTDRPLVGFLTDRSLLEDGATANVGDWTTPMLEPEIAVYISDDLTIGGLAAAIELADLDPPPADPEAILAGNIYHRHVLLGPVDRTRTSADGITMRLTRDGEEIAATDTPEALTGKLADVVRLTAEALGEHLRPGDVVITGSTVPPVRVAPGERISADLGPLGALTVVLA